MLSLIHSCGLGKMIDKKLLFTSAVIVAAGSASRMGGINKIFYELDGIPVIIRTLLVFQQCREIDEIVLVVPVSYTHLLTVQRLERVSYGGIKLGGLKPGCWRYLTEDEIRCLKKEI